MIRGGGREAAQGDAVRSDQSGIECATRSICQARAKVYLRVTRNVGSPRDLRRIRGGLPSRWRADGNRRRAAWRIAASRRNRAGAAGQAEREQSNQKREFTQVCSIQILAPHRDTPALLRRKRKQTQRLSGASHSSCECWLVRPENRYCLGVQFPDRRRNDNRLLLRVAGYGSGPRNVPRRGALLAQWLSYRSWRCWRRSGAR